MKLSTLLAAVILTFELGAQESEGRIKARGKPGAAGIFVDGKYVGPASRFTVAESYPVPAGEHTVTLSDPRYKDFTTKVTVAAGKTTKISYKLEPADPAKPPYGRLRFSGGEPESFMSVTAGDTSAVFINEKFYGYVDELNNAGGGLLLPPGTYDLRVSSPIHGEISQKVTLEANKVTRIPLKRK